MAYSKQHIALVRSRILDEANQLFRRQGYFNTSIDQIMESANLTRGGFYAHFKSKEDLFTQAMRRDLNFTLALRDQAEKVESPQAAAYSALQYYLDKENIQRVGNACTLVSLTSEIARMKAATRKAYTGSLVQLLDELAGLLGGEEKAVDCLISAVGALSIARAVTDSELAEKLLERGLSLGTKD